MMDLKAVFVLLTAAAAATADKMPPREDFCRSVYPSRIQAFRNSFDYHEVSFAYGFGNV